MIYPRNRYLVVALLSALLIISTSFYLSQRSEVLQVPAEIISEIHDQIIPPKPTGPVLKPTSSVKPLPIVDNFPLAAAARSAADLPPIPRWNTPPAVHVAERTPLFIGFTRNWRLLQQVVVSYITAGWPPEDIYVVENTGVLDANQLGQLSLQNPFFLNHTRLELLGVNVIITPTLFTFAQLQNFYLWTATSKKWSYYFWSHMDVVAVPFEFKYREEHPEADLASPTASFSDFRSIYDYCLAALREVLVAKGEDGKPLRWAMRFFSYDRLALVNVSAFREVGGWDTQIPFYGTDCDMHARLEMANFNIEEKPSGLIYDVASSLDDLIVLYRKTKGPKGEVAPPSFVDPNVVDEELRAIAESEELLEKQDWAAGVADKHAAATRDVQARDTTLDEISRLEFSASAKGEPASLPSSSSSATVTAASGWTDDHPDSSRFADLMHTLERMQGSKNSEGHTRNSWQARQRGGEGDPFYRDSAGFEQAILMTIEHGRRVFGEKWGHRDCDIVAKGLRPEMAWRVERDWDD